MLKAASAIPSFMVVVTLLGPEHVFWESLSLNEDFFGSAGTALSPALHP